MEFKQGFVNNKKVKIHYLDNEIKTSLTPLLICPGLSESAKDYLNLMKNINNRRCVSFSFRGRGESEVPSVGYTLEDHVKDIECVIKELNLEDICIMGVSRGVSYELGYVTSSPNFIKGLIINEYSPEHKKMPTGWARESMDFYDKHCDSISITYEALKGIEDDSEQVDFVEKLIKITCPTLILKGELEESLLDKEDIKKYVDNLGSTSIRVEKFKNAGHDIQDGDFEKLVKVINEFLVSID